MPRFIKNSQHDLMKSRSILINSLEVFEEITWLGGQASCNWHAPRKRTGSIWQNAAHVANTNGEHLKCLMMKKVRKSGARKKIHKDISHRVRECLSDAARGSLRGRWEGPGFIAHAACNPQDNLTTLFSGLDTHICTVTPSFAHFIIPPSFLSNAQLSSATPWQDRAPSSCWCHS